MPAIMKKRMQMDGDVDEVDMETRAEDRDADVNTSTSSTSVTVPSTGLQKGLDSTEVLPLKRKRMMPAAEFALSEWLDNNLEKRTEESIHLPLLYQYYTEVCQASNGGIVDIPQFNKMIKDKFGKSFGIQPSSVYKSVIKERKINGKKKPPGQRLTKDIIMEAINNCGNPYNGIRFFNLKIHIASRYPALQVDLKPKSLKRALEWGMTNGYVELVKGMGMAGFYRLPGAVPLPPKAKAKKEGEAEEQEGEKPAEEKDSKTEEGTKTDENNEKPSEEKEEGAEDSKEETTDLKKKPKPAKWSYNKINFSNPSKLEDTFPLAVTYQSAPKAAHVGRIRRYILEKFGEEVPDHRWKKALESGCEKGLWENVAGAGMHLLMDDFDPTSEDLKDRICAAIIASHEPKSASALQIKKYVMNYHPEFGVEQHPNRFKKALERAVEKHMIRRLTGCGASGTFQLVVPFTPSPAVLAGDSDEEEDEDDENAQIYIPRGTKSRGNPKPKSKAAAQVASKSKSASNKPKTPTKTTVVSGRGRPSSKSTTAVKNKNSSGNSSDKRKSKSSSSSNNKSRSLSPLTDEEEEEEVVEYTPKKSKSRGGASSPRPTPNKGNVKSTPISSKKKAAAKAKTQSKSSTPAKTPPSNTKPLSNRKAVVELRHLDSDDDEIEYTPRKSSSRGGLANGTSSSSRKRKMDEEDDDGDDYVTPKKKATPKSTKKQSSGGKRKGRR